MVMLAFAIPCCIYFCCPCRRVRHYNNEHIYINDNSNNFKPDDLPA